MTASLYNACLKDYCRVSDSAYITGNAVIKNSAHIRNSALILGNAVIGGGVCITGESFIRGDAQLLGNWEIELPVRFSHTPLDCYVAGPIGSRDDITTFYVCADDHQIWAETGCFVGTINEFCEAVDRTHRIRKPCHYDEYNFAIDSAIRILKRRNDYLKGDDNYADY